MSFGSFGQRPGGFGSFGSSASTPGFGAQNTTTPGFGQATGSFGAPQPQSTGFGGFGQPPSTPAPAFGGGTGAFGAQQTPAFGQVAQTPAFGATQPSAPGFGSFGSNASSTPAFGGGFGSAARPPFGASAPSQPLFGATPNNNAFGGAGNLFNAAAQQPLDPSKWPDEFGDLFMIGHPADQDDARTGWIQPAIPQEGTGNTGLFDPTNPREYKEPFGSEEGKNTPAKLREERVRSGWNGNPLDWEPVKKKLESRKDAKLRYHAITAVEPFRNASFEELRLQDYMQNRRAPTQQKPQEKIMAYNQFSADPPLPIGPSATPFGAAPASGAFSFGAKPAGFGTTPAAPGFGTPAASNTFGFGGSQGSTGFGTTNASPFGQPQATNTFGASTGTFGTPAQSNTFGAPTSAPSTFGGFGTTPAQPVQSNPFNFGQTPAASGALSFGSTPAPNPPTSFGGFGSAPKPAAPAFSFGGQPTATTTAATPNFFGATPAAPAANAFGSQPPQTNAFGASAPTQPLFGQTNTSTANLFGGGSTNSGFGASASQPAFGSFNKPPASTAAPFSFGNPTPAPNFNFGNTSQNKPLSFGTQSTPQPFGGFGASTTGGLGGSTGTFGFGSMLGQPQQGLPQNQQQPTLQASIDQNAYGQAQSALFNVPAASAAAPAAPFAVQEKSKPPLTLPPRATPRTSVHALTRLRGINTPTSTTSNGVSLSFSSPASSSRGSPLSSLPSLGAGTSPMISPRAFVGRHSVKRLVIEPQKAISPASDGKAVGRLQFDPDAEVAASQSTPLRAITAGPSTTPASQANGSTQRSTHADHSGTASASKSPGTSAYILSPSLEELRQMSPTELKRVERFKVTRPGLGEIAWEDAVDLSGVGSLDKIAGSIVSIVPRKASVYAVEDFGNNKPPPGKGLNTPARVTLHDIWPVDLATRKPIKERGINDDLDARIEEFERKLTGYNSRRPTVTRAMYDFPNGTWIFHVEHFSGYGLDDDGELIDSKGGQEMDDEQPRRGLPPKLKPKLATPPPEEMEMDEDGTESDMDDQGPPTPLSASLDHDNDVSDEGKHDAGSRDYRSHTPEFTMDEEELESPAFPSKSLQSAAARIPWISGQEPGREQLMRGTLFSATGKGKAAPRQASLRFFLPPAIETPEVDDIEKIRPPQRRPYSLHRIPFAQSVSVGHEGDMLDSGLSLGRSFRVSFGPRGELVRPAFRGDGYPLAVSKPLQRCLTDTTSTLPLLDVQLSRTDVRRPVQGAARALPAPLANTHSDLRFRDFAAIVESSSEANVIRLASALFDDLDLQLPHGSDEVDRQRALALSRQRALSDWLEFAVRKATDSDLRNAQDTAERIFVRLTGHQVEAACDVALNDGNLRLATLLAQAGTQDLDVRRDIALQLARWREQRADAHIDATIRKIYEILAGNVSVSDGVSNSEKVDQSADIFIPAGLDWKRTFGLHLWYAAPRPTLELAFASYTNALASDGRLSRPLPAWAVGTQVSIPAHVNDAAFDLLRLAASDYPLELALDPLGFAKSALDVALPWHFTMTLSRALMSRNFEDTDLNVNDMPWRASATADGLTTAYALQLELAGNWAWAAFVLLHLSSPQCRARGVREMLARNVDHLEDETLTKFLTETLEVPAEWLYEAQALRAHYNGDFWQEMSLRQLAKDFNESHRLCVTALAPEAVLADDTELLHRLFLPLEPFEIAGWQDGGGLFLDYAACLDRDSDPARLAQLTPRLLAALPALVRTRGRHDLRARACYSTMLARCSKLASAVDSSLRSLEGVDAQTLTSNDRLAFLSTMTNKTFQASLGAAMA